MIGTVGLCDAHGPSSLSLTTRKDFDLDTHLCSCEPGCVLVIGERDRG